MKFEDKRIADALQEHVETPDMTGSVMARLPVQRHSRLKWVYAAAVPILLAVALLLLSRGHKPEQQVVRRPAPVKQTPMVQPAPKPIEAPQVIVERPTKPAIERRTPRKHRHIPKKQVVKSPQEPNETPPSDAGSSEYLAMIQQSINRRALEQMRSMTHTLPPNVNAETTERPALMIIANCGPMQAPIDEIGG